MKVDVVVRPDLAESLKHSSALATLRRAGRAWPMAGSTVEVVDQDDDQPGPAIGRRTLAELQADARFEVTVIP